MSVVEPPVAPAVPPAGAGPSPQELAWLFAEGEAASVMGTVNVAVARLVAALRVLVSSDGWVGPGVQSPEHWLTWKAGIARGRAEGLVRIARRAGELPACWALFEQGRLGEDAMVRIARHVPACRDAEVAGLAPRLLISQLDRLLRSLPEQADGSDRPPPPGPERMCELRERRDGWLRGRFCLPPDEAAVLRLGLMAARDAEFGDRTGLGPDAPDGPGPAAPDELVDPRVADGLGGAPGRAGHLERASDAVGVRGVSWADGLVRMAAEAVDGLDPTLARTGERAERNLVVLHHDIDPDGTLGPGQIEMGPVVPGTVARFMSCDAKVQVLTYQHGRLIGINPAERTPNRATRRYLARRDQGCTHPLCGQRRWLHAHHIVHWADNGRTEPQNLTLLCPRHHRALHMGEFRIQGNPETGTLRFLDRYDRPIQPPDPDPPGGAPPPDGPGPDAPPPGATSPGAETPGTASAPDGSHRDAPHDSDPPGSDPLPGGDPTGRGPRSDGRQPGSAPRAFTPPLAERLRSDTFTWS